MDVDAGTAVGVLRHHPGDHGHLPQIQLVGDAVDEDGEQAGIGQHDLLPVLGGGVAVKNGVNIRQQKLLDAGQLLHHLAGDLGCAALVFQRQRQRNLLGETGFDPLQQQRGVVRRRQRHQCGVAEIGGEHQLTHFLQQCDDSLAVRQAQAAAVHGNVSVFHGFGHCAGRVADIFLVHGYSSDQRGVDR